jgi:hypothetical protein
MFTHRVWMSDASNQKKNVQWSCLYRLFWLGSFLVTAANLMTSFRAPFSWTWHETTSLCTLITSPSRRHGRGRSPLPACHDKFLRETEQPPPSLQITRPTSLLLSTPQDGVETSGLLSYMIWIFSSIVGCGMLRAQSNTRTKLTHTGPLLTFWSWHCSF